VTLFRCFGWNAEATPMAPDGPLWIPRAWQGDGRHDNPDLYGCLYLSEHRLSPIVEQLAPFRGGALTASMLRRRGWPLALAAIELTDDVPLVDLDDPRVLRQHRLRPSRVATRRRDITQPQARQLFERRKAVGVRWWSSFEALWMNVTLFDRGLAHVRLGDIRSLAIDDPLVRDAAEHLGLR
jgi:hypothetical protein